LLLKLLAALTAELPPNKTAKTIIMLFFFMFLLFS